MIKQATIQIRLTKQQKERILNNMHALGKKTLSDYARSILLEHDLSANRMIREIYAEIVKKENNGQS